MIQISHLFDNVWARLLYHYMALNDIYVPCIQSNLALT